MIPQVSHIFVVMVHYGDPAVTTEALAALWSGSRTPDQVIIVDHAEEPLILPPHAGHRVVRPAANAGYAAGLNVGLGMIFTADPEDSDIVVCMNNDTLVGAESLQRLAVYCAASDPALVGTRWGVINPITGRSRVLAAHLPRPATLASLSYIDGSFFAAPWSIFYRLKKIPDEYFMYWEESALNRQLLTLGIARHVVANLGIRHDDATSAAPSRLHTYYLVRNGAHYLQTATPWFVRAWWRSYNGLRYLYHSLRPAWPAGRGKRSAVVAQALGDALRGNMGKGNVSP